MKTQSDQKTISKLAVKRLRSQHFFNEVLEALDAMGLVGEQQNALALFIIAISRLMARPLNAFVKACSSAGKNWLVKLVLRLIPPRCVLEVTGASEKAWSYVGDNLQHRIVYLQERNERSEAVHPVRLLVSENRLVRIVTARVNGEFKTQKYVTKGPITAISTTTKEFLTIDDENRHVSLWVDESAEQTRRVLKGYLRSRKTLSKKERHIWYAVQRLLERRAARVKIDFPHWFSSIIDHIAAEDIRLRRYFPFFVEAVRTVALIRSFQSDSGKRNRILITFTDFAIAAIIFDRVFVETLIRRDDHRLETRQVVERLSKKHNQAVGAKDLARELQISPDAAYTRLRQAARSGLIQKANAPEKTNVKRYLPTAVRFLPDPADLYRKLNIHEEIRFAHPLSGEIVEYKRNRRNA